MQIPLILISALTPVVVLLWYIYRKDKVRPEPAKCLLKAFGFGVLSAFLSFVFSVPVSFLLGMEIDANTYSSISKAFAETLEDSSEVKTEEDVLLSLKGNDLAEYLANMPCITAEDYLAFLSEPCKFDEK